MKFLNYFMAILAMTQLLIACDHGSTTSNQRSFDGTSKSPVALSAPVPPRPGEGKEEMVAEDMFVPKAENKSLSNIKSKDNEEFNTEDYDHIIENNFHTVAQEPLSTFSIDVDRASYSNIRRYIEQGMLPPKGAVRIEEMVNYFDYKYAPPTNDDPFAVHTEIASCPWNLKHKLVQIGLQGKKICNRKSSFIQSCFSYRCFRFYGSAQ